jgi:hypothetical protein
MLLHLSLLLREDSKGTILEFGITSKSSTRMKRCAKARRCARRSETLSAFNGIAGAPKYNELGKEIVHTEAG